MDKNRRLIWGVVFDWLDTGISEQSLESVASPFLKGTMKNPKALKIWMME